MHRIVQFALRFQKLLRDQLMVLAILCIIGMCIPWDTVITYSSQILAHAREMVEQQPLAIAVAYVAIFVFLTAISTPGPTSLVLAVTGGWLFGWWGVPLSSFSSSAGGSLAFLGSRYWMRDSTLFRFMPAIQRFNQTRSSANWVVLLSCRLNPLIPYFLENLYFARTRMPLWQFWLVTFLGMLPITILYVMTGRQLAQVETYQGIIPWKIVLCYVAVSLLPLFILWLMHQFRPHEVAYSGKTRFGEQENDKLECNDV